MQAKDVKSARARFQQLLKINPKESRAWLALALLDLRENNESGYLQNLEQAKKADDKQVLPRLELTRYWLGKRDAGKALVEARSALEATGRSDFNEYIGLALLMQGDNANALATFAKWVENNPKNPLAHFRLAQAQLNAKDNASALKSLDKALALQPAYMEADLTKALLLSRMGRNEEGLKIARAWQTKAPKAPGGFLAEAEILFNNKTYLEAGKQFAKGAQIANQGALLGKAYQAYVLAGQAKEGEKLLADWLQKHPSDGLVRHQLAMAQLNAKRLKESAENYRVLTQANPKDLIAYNNLAWILGELRDKDAITIAEQAHRLQPDSPATQDTLGWILVNLGQVQKGLGLLAKAHDKDPSAAEIHWHFAAALAKSGDRARAKQELEKLVYSGSDFPQKAEAKRLMESL
jgi:putative PEP-CTERM system TPR-repeat lipoprotein